MPKIQWLPAQFGCALAGIGLSFLFALTICYTPALVSAQTRDSATVKGRVLDQTGNAIAEAGVRLENVSTGLKRETRTDQDGAYILVGLPLTGQYTLTVAKAQFSTIERKGLELRAGEVASLDVMLDVAGGQSSVTVYGTAEGVEANSAEVGERLDVSIIGQTPLLGRKLSSLPLLDSAVRPARGTGDLFLNNTLFVVNGGGRRQTTFAVDNSTGDDSWGRQALFTSIPFSAVQEFTVLTNATSAEYGRTTASAVNIVTKSGTNAFHGELAGLWRPSELEASAPLAITHAGDVLKQISGGISGPVWKDRTHFLLSSEYSNQVRDSVVTSPLAFGSFFTGKFREALVLARLDHQLGSRNALMARVNFDRFSDTNPADVVGGTTMPSAARTFRRNTYAAQLSETATFSPRLINEARFQFQLGSPITAFDPMTPSTQFVRTGFATEGESRSASLLNHQVQFADTLSWSLSKHLLKMGAEVIHSSSGGFGQEFGSGFVLGQFNVKANVTKPLAQLTIADMDRYMQSFGNSTYHVGETLWALFVQDNFAATSRLALNLGLRYERQTFTDSTLDLSPRIGFAYRLPLSRPSVIRGSYGIYYSEVRANLAAGYELNGPTGIFTFTADPGQLGFPTSLAPLVAFPAGAILPPRDITVRPGRRAFLSQFFDVSKLRFYPEQLLNPYTQQWTLGLERELFSHWLLSADYVGNHTIRIERPVDLNAPSPFARTRPGQTRTAAAADITRPIRPVDNGYKRIVATVNEGAAYYHGLRVNLKRRFGQRFSALASYTWSHTLGTVEPDAPQQDPDDSTQLGRTELASSLLDQRHRLTVSGWYSFPWQITVGTFTSLASGRPYNVITGVVDNNGDGSRSDRPVINGSVVPRNFGRGTPLYDVSVFVEKGMRIAERWNLSVRGEAFNLFNHRNIVGRNGTFGNLPSGVPLTTFGQPLGGVNNVDPSRQFQFLLRLRF